MGDLPVVDLGAAQSPPPEGRGEPAGPEVPAGENPVEPYNPNPDRLNDDDEGEDEGSSDGSESGQGFDREPFRRRSPLPVPILLDNPNRPIPTKLTTFDVRDFPPVGPGRGAPDPAGSRFPGSVDLWTSEELRYANEWGKCFF